MSNVSRWSRFLTAISGAIAILLAGIGLSRAHVIQDQGTALWPTYTLLNLEVFHGPLPVTSTMWFPFFFHVLVWTAIIYTALSLLRHLREQK